MRSRLIGLTGTSLALLGASLTAASARPDAASGAITALPHVDGAALARAQHGAPSFRIGFAKASLDPSPADIKAGIVHLGGYGIAPTRATTGPMVLPDGTPEHLYARAMAVRNDRGQVLLLADLENQGTFAAYKQCACGITDIRQTVATRLGVPMDSIVVNSDHSHSGPDLIGLWGGVPVSYLRFVHDQTVEALETAYERAVPAYLLAGTSTPVMPTPSAGGYLPGTATPGEALVHSQFTPDTATGHDDSAVDRQLRVLQAVTADGRLLGTLINYAAHATITGSGNLAYSADWPGWVARRTEVALNEPVVVTMVADVGRSQPPRPSTDKACGKAGHPSCDADGLDTYSRILLPFVLSAVHDATAPANTTIANHEVFTREPATNAVLLGVGYTAEVPLNGYGAYRATTPPWVTGNVIGTFVSAHRVGDLLFTAAPGEAYPDIRFGVQQAVKGYRDVFTFGLANDQLGYLIAPASEYPWVTASQPGNDNSLFNVSPSYGDHVFCAQTASATRVGFRATGAADPYGTSADVPPCTAYGTSDAIPAGPQPQQPWPWGNGVPGPTPP